MARRRSNAKQNIVATLIITLVVGLFGTGGYILYTKKSAFNELDPVTLCPKSGATSELVVLVDNSDSFNEIQKESIKNKMNKIIKKLPKHAGLTVYAIEVNGAIHEPIAKLCNPGDGSDESKIYSNPAYFKNAQDKAFASIKNSLNNIDRGVALNSSPIMENIQAIAIKDFDSRTEGSKELIVISDFIQHVPEFSMYEKSPSLANFTKTTYAKSIRSDFQDVKVKLYVLNNKNQRHNVDQDKLLDFWKGWFEFQGADEVYIDRISG